MAGRLLRVFAPIALALISAARPAVDPGSTAGVVPARGADALARARDLEKAHDWNGVAELLSDTLKRGESGPELHELLANALARIERGDEAAHHLDLAVRAWTDAGQDDRARTALSELRRIDPLSQRRDAFLKRATTTLADAADELLAGGHAERALTVFERLPRIARGKDLARVRASLEKARAGFVQVNLDDASAAVPTSGEFPVCTYESAHYRFSCALEPAVVKRLGSVMDDIFGYYVRIYFDGDAKKVRGQKATIRVLPNKDAMLALWTGPGSPEGWWSAGENQVVAYDTRAPNVALGTSGGSLDALLETLFHEASHQFMSLVAGSGFVPAWINEGTASFFEGTVAMADGRVLWPRAATRRLQALIYEFSEASAPTAREVVSYAEPASYPADYYAFGWGLVYFLQEYEDPKTFEHVYRPLYARYRSEVIRRGGDPMKVFEETFLGSHSPLGHADFDAFAKFWEQWIRTEVDPLYETTLAARTKRLTKVDALLAAAASIPKTAKKKAPVSESELLERALAHVEWVRTHIDREDKPDGALLLQQADIFERLNRPAAAAPLVEKALDLADAGHFKVEPTRYAELEARLAKLDRKNAALRAARARTAELARAAQSLIDEYRAGHFVLRSCTLAADLSAALGEDAGLAPIAKELREKARAAGLLLGSIRALRSTKEHWTSVITAEPIAFEIDADGVKLDTVRGSAFVDGAVDVAGEYAVRAHIERAGKRELGSAVGLVFAGRPDGWTIAGADDQGRLGLWTIDVKGTKGSTSIWRTQTLVPKPLIAADEALDLVVHVFTDGRVTVQAGAREPLETHIALDPLLERHVGVFAKNAAARFESPVVELMP